MKFPAFASFRRWVWPRLLPVNLTVSVTYTCTSRRKTCDIWKKKATDDEIRGARDNWKKVLHAMRLARSLQRGAPDGFRWGCCVRAEPVGSLRESGYDFPRVCFSPEADRLRTSVAARECACPLANASCTNMLASPRSLARVARNLLP